MAALSTTCWAVTARYSQHRIVVDVTDTAAILSIYLGSATCCSTDRNAAKRPTARCASQRQVDAELQWRSPIPVRYRRKTSRVCCSPTVSGSGSATGMGWASLSRKDGRGAWGRIWARIVTAAAPFPLAAMNSTDSVNPTEEREG
jgi:hypothetical protein